MSSRVVDSSRDSGPCIGSFCLDANSLSEEVLDSGNASQMQVIPVDSVGGLNKFLGAFAHPTNLSSVFGSRRSLILREEDFTTNRRMLFN